MTDDIDPTPHASRSPMEHERDTPDPLDWTDEECRVFFDAHSRTRNRSYSTAVDCVRAGLAAVKRHKKDRT